MFDSEVTTKPVAPASLGGDKYEKSRKTTSQISSGNFPELARLIVT